MKPPPRRPCPPSAEPQRDAPAALPSPTTDLCTASLSSSADVRPPEIGGVGEQSFRFPRNVAGRWRGGVRGLNVHDEVKMVSIGSSMELNFFK